MGIAISRSSALSINMLLTFDMDALNGPLCLKTFLFGQLFKASSSKSIALLTTIYALL